MRFLGWFRRKPLTLKQRLIGMALLRTTMTLAVVVGATSLGGCAVREDRVIMTAPQYYVPHYREFGSDGRGGFYARRCC
jgi:hypothetical protein